MLAGCVLLNGRERQLQDTDIILDCWFIGLWLLPTWSQMASECPVSTQGTLSIFSSTWLPGRTLSLAARGKEPDARDAALAGACQPEPTRQLTLCSHPCRAKGKGAGQPRGKEPRLPTLNFSTPACHERQPSPRLKTETLWPASHAPVGGGG